MLKLLRNSLDLISINKLAHCFKNNSLYLTNISTVAATALIHPMCNQWLPCLEHQTEMY